MELEHLALAALAYGLLNILVFCVYWWDKQAAIEGAWRISESTLLTLAFLGGSAGAITAQRMLRHKTRKEPFRTILALIASAHVILAMFATGIWLFSPSGTLVDMLRLSTRFQ